MFQFLIAAKQTIPKWWLKRIQSHIIITPLSSGLTEVSRLVLTKVFHVVAVGW